MYLMVAFQNISHMVGLLNRFSHTAQEIHWHASLNFLAYLKHGPRHDLLYQCHGHLYVRALLDSNYVNDYCGQKSTSNFCTYVGEIL